MGNLLKVVVGAANMHDTVVGCGVFRSVLKKYPSILGVCGGAGFRGTFVDFVLSLGKKCDISEKIVSKALVFCLGVGVWSEHLVGLCGLDGYLRIMKY